MVENHNLPEAITISSRSVEYQSVINRNLKNNNMNQILCYQKLDFHQLIGIHIEEIPHYLRADSESFQKFILSFLSKTIEKHSEDLRQIAIVMHKILLLEKVDNLWLIYRKSGMGIIKLPKHFMHLRRKIWPFNVRVLVQQILNTADPDHNTYQLFVDYCLERLQNKSEACFNELNNRINSLANSIPNMESIIETFVRRHFIDESLEYDCQIALVQYHYIDELIKYYYLASNPDEKQVKSYRSS